MTSKELRKQRRREEHQARKEAIRTGQPTPVLRDEEPDTPQQTDAPPLRGVLSEALDFNDPEWVTAEEFSSGFRAYAKSVSDCIGPKAGLPPRTGPRFASENATPTLPPADHAERNRKNAQHSTGPRTAEGKAQASKNAFRHGLASNRFLVLDWESTVDFDDLVDNLRAEHRPATQTEALLVEKMAEHFWLSQRALRLQDICFRLDVPICDQPQEFALYTRYGATHDRAFHKCIAQLQKLRAEQRKVETGFVSQKRQELAETRKQELHAARVAVVTSKKRATEQIRERKTLPARNAATSSASCSDAEQLQELPSVPLKRAEIPAQASSQAA